MTEPRLEYVAPLPQALTYQSPKPIWARIPWPFVVVVVIPTLIAAIYYLLIASPLYVSEARFVVRSAGVAPSALGVALQGVGLSSTTSDAFAVHEYVTSSESIADLEKQFDLAQMLGPRSADFLTRYPRPGESRTAEGLQKALKRFVVIGYDSTTGISTLRVEAFRPEDARRLGVALLDGGELLVNRLNVRSVNDAVADARLARDQAQIALTQAQQQITAFRNSEQFIDPTKSAAESSELIGRLMVTIAELEAERSQVAASAPQSPQLPGIDNRLAAYNRQLAAERAKIAGNASSLAPRVGAYEELSLKRELAGEQLSQTTAALLSAEHSARRQQLYLERIVSPTLPQEPLEPHRWQAILIVLASTLLAYGIGWLVYAGVREHRQA